VRHRWALVACMLVLTLAVVGVVATPATTLFGTRYQVGETIVFEVEDTTTWWWGCCSCDSTQIYGWRIVDGAGVTVYSVVHDAPVSAAVWQGSWIQVDASGAAVPVGQYRLHVDTSLGTLTRCFSIYDPCGCNTACTSCSSCSCEQLTSISSCSCKATLVFVDDSPCVFPFFGLFGGCCSSPCGGGCTNP